MSNYFNKRLIDLLKADIKRSKRLEKNIRSGYKLAKGLIEADIEKYTSRIADELELDLNKLNKKLSIEDMKVLAQSLGVSDDFYASYANLSYMEAIRLEMAKSIRKLADDNESLIYDHLAATFENNYYTTCYELYKTMDDFAFKKKVTTEYFDFLAKKPWTADGKTFSQKIWTNQERLINELSREFVVSATRGANIKESAKRLSQRMDIDYKRCVRLLNTEDSFFSNQAVLEAYKNTTSEQYRILATLDSRTCDVCGSVDLKVFNIKDAKAGINLPPFHPNCRCTTTIYFEDDEEADERIMRDKDGKSVKDEFMSYNEWKKKYVDKVDNIDEKTVNVGINKAEEEEDKKEEGTKLSDKNLGKLSKALKKEDFNEFVNVLNNHENESIKTLYRKYGDQLDSINYNSKGSYAPDTNILNISTTDQNLYPDKNKYATIAHEFGHVFDFKSDINLSHDEVEAISDIVGKRLAPNNILSSSDAFIEAARKDKESLLKQGFDALKKAMIDDDASAGVQDAIDGFFIGPSHRIGWGHGEKYYNRKYEKIKEYSEIFGDDYETKLLNMYKEKGLDVKKEKDVKSLIRDYDTAVEMWANIASAETTGGKELEYVKKYLPNAHEAFLKIIKEIK